MVCQTSLKHNTATALIIVLQLFFSGNTSLFSFLCAVMTEQSNVSFFLCPRHFIPNISRLIKVLHCICYNTVTVKVSFRQNAVVYTCSAVTFRTAACQQALKFLYKKACSIWGIKIKATLGTWVSLGCKLNILVSVHYSVFIKML